MLGRWRPASLGRVPPPLVHPCSHYPCAVSWDIPYAPCFWSKNQRNLKRRSASTPAWENEILLYRNYPVPQTGTSGCCNLEDDLGQPTWILLSGPLTPPITPHVKTWFPAEVRFFTPHSSHLVMFGEQITDVTSSGSVRLKVSHANTYEALWCGGNGKHTEGKKWWGVQEAVHEGQVVTVCYSHKHHNTL